MRNSALTGILLAVAALFLYSAYSGEGIRHLVSRFSSTTEPLAARVSGHPITRSQLDRALNEQLWLTGKSAAELSAAELDQARKSALDELIDHELLRLQIKENTPPIEVADEEINERLRRLVGRFESKGALESAMKAQGIASEQNLRDRLAARIRQEKFIARSTESSTKVTDDEARQWFEANPAAVSIPERIQARHIFIPTLDHPPEEAKLKLEAALEELTEKKKDFASLAKEISEDPATKNNSGNLGWMTRERLPADFSVPVFSQEINKPSLVRTKLGWHLVEITARKPAEARSFEQAKPEILAALTVINRQQAVENYRKSLRQSQAPQIEIFKDTPN